jgi:ATP-dependent DNA helicase RecG
MLTYPITLQAGPGPLQAFVPDPDPDAIAASAVALANTDGGVMIVGLDERGAATGLPDGPALDRALRQAAERCTPPITFAFRQTVITPAGPVLALAIPRGRKVHALHDGQVTVRAARDNRVLNGAEIRQLLSTRTNGEFEAEPVPGATPGSLDPNLVADFLIHRRGRLGQSPAGGQDDLLTKMGAVTPDYRVTVAGMLLFGRDPQRWLPASGARFVRMVGGNHVAFERTISGTVTQIVERVWEQISQQMRADSESGIPEQFVPLAVREALVNAVCHRDYRLRGEGITVTMRPDRLDITSPGGLPGFMTMEHLINGRFSRNPRLAWALFHWGYIPEPGQGIISLMASMDRRGCRPPEIETGPYRVNVRLYSAETDATGGSGDEGAGEFNARQRQALAHVREHGSITLRELRTLCSDSRPEQLQRDLVELVARGRLRKIGSRTSAYYIMP